MLRIYWRIPQYSLDHWGNTLLQKERAGLSFPARRVPGEGLSGDGCQEGRFALCMLQGIILGVWAHKIRAYPPGG